MRSEIRPVNTREPIEARRTTNSMQTGLFTIFQNYLKECLYDGASSVIHPLMNRVLILIDKLKFTPPELERYTNKSKDSLDELLKGSVEESSRVKSLQKAAIENARKTRKHSSSFFSYFFPSFGKAQVFEVINSQRAASHVEEYLRAQDIPSSVKVIEFCRRVFSCMR